MAGCARSRVVTVSRLWGTMGKFQRPVLVAPANRSFQPEAVVPTPSLKDSEGGQSMPPWPMCLSEISSLVGDETVETKARRYAMDMGSHSPYAATLMDQR